MKIVIKWRCMYDSMLNVQLGKYEIFFPLKAAFLPFFKHRNEWSLAAAATAAATKKRVKIAVKLWSFFFCFMPSKDANL